jgi:DNA-binding PadR family transcriptional regulator
MAPRVTAYRPENDAVARHLPLKPVLYLLLVALRRGERYGYTLQRDVEELSEGTVQLDPGTLYRWLGRLLDDRLLERAEPLEGDADDARRRYYRLSRLGEAVLAAESQRLGRLVVAAQGAGAVETSTR